MLVTIPVKIMSIPTKNDSIGNPVGYIGIVSVLTNNCEAFIVSFVWLAVTSMSVCCTLSVALSDEP